MPIVPPYTCTLAVHPGTLNAAPPAEKYYALRPFYYSAGKRFATPVNLRLKGQLDHLNMSVEPDIFERALTQSINKCSPRLRPLM